MLNRIAEGEEIDLTKEFDSKYSQEILGLLQEKLEAGEVDINIYKAELAKQISMILKIRILQKQKIK